MKKKIKRARKPTDLERYRQEVLDILGTALIPVMKRLSDEIALKSIKTLYKLK